MIPRTVFRILGFPVLFCAATALAQPSAKLPPRIGLLVAGGLGANSPLTLALKDGLRPLGYSETQRTVAFEIRNAEGHRERLRPLADELVRARVDLIFAGGDQAIAAAKEATGTIPIVMVACDAMSAGLITNLARPGGNLTGVTCVNSDLAAKRLEILKEAFPKLARVGVLLNPDDRRMRTELAETEKAALVLKIAVRPVRLAVLADFGPALAAAVAGRSEALVVAYDDLTIIHRQQFAGLAIAHRQPTIHNFREYVDAGGLISYGPSLAGMWRSAAGHVDKVLKGARPGELPIEQPTRFELVINRKTEKALGIVIPQSLLLRADAVIE